MMEGFFFLAAHGALRFGISFTRGHKEHIGVEEERCMSCHFGAALSHSKITETCVSSSKRNVFDNGITL